MADTKLTKAQRSEINRTNGAKGGPRTAEGKEKCRLNALKHGLRAQAARLPNEDPEELRLAYLGWYDSHPPRSAHERNLIDRLVAAQVIHDRCGRRLAAVAAEQVHNAGVRLDQARDERVAHFAARFAAEPAEAVAGLRSCAAGCRWLGRRWAELLGRLDAVGTLLQPDRRELLRLRGVPPGGATIRRPEVFDVHWHCTMAEPAPSEDDVRGLLWQVPASLRGAFRARLDAAGHRAVVRGWIEDALAELKAREAALREGAEAVEDALAADRAVLIEDPKQAGLWLRYYRESGSMYFRAARELARSRSEPVEDEGDDSPNGPNDDSPNGPNDDSPNGPNDDSPNGPNDDSPNGPNDDSPNGPNDDSPNGPNDDSPNGPNEADDPAQVLMVQSDCDSPSGWLGQPPAQPGCPGGSRSDGGVTDPGCPTVAPATRPLGRGEENGRDFVDSPNGPNPISPNGPNRISPNGPNGADDPAQAPDPTSGCDEGSERPDAPPAPVPADWSWPPAAPSITPPGPDALASLLNDDDYVTICDARTGAMSGPLAAALAAIEADAAAGLGPPPGAPPEAWQAPFWPVGGAEAIAEMLAEDRLRDLPGAAELRAVTLRLRDADLSDAERRRLRAAQEAGFDALLELAEARDGPGP